MTTGVRADQISNSAGDGPPGFPFGITGANVTQTDPGLVASAGQLLATNTDDSPGSDKVGYSVQSIVAEGSAVSILNVTGTAITSINIPPGDWNIDFCAQIKGTQSVGVSNFNAGVSSVSGLLAVAGDSGIRDVLPAGTYSKSATLMQHVPVHALTTYYLNVTQDTGATWQGWGRITATRRR